MTPHRHQLAYVRPTRLQELALRADDERVRAALLHWAMHRLPLVVTRQEASARAGVIRVGLPLPKQWGRLRRAFLLELADVLYFSTFPCLSELSMRTNVRTYSALKQLSAALATHALRARVYGSYGWQHLTALDYTHAQSDMDLLIAVHSLQQADQAAACLAAFEQTHAARLRLDGELMFADGSAVAWREWLPWRTGRSRQILIKQAEGAALADDASWLAKLVPSP